MKFKISRLVAAASFVCAFTGAALADEPTSAPVRIQDCVSTASTPAITFPSLDSSVFVTQQAMPAMVIVGYVNTTSMPIATIDFGLVSGGKLAAMFRDVGMFAPQAHIMHAFGIYNKDLPYQHSLMSCVPLRIRYADGTSWTNPALPSH